MLWSLSSGNKCPSAVVLISGETSFRNPVADQAILSRLEFASRKSWAQLLKEHKERFTSLFDRVALELPDSENLSSLATDQRLARAKKEGLLDNGLIALMFAYGRYLLIASSLSGLPANLQGIWNPDHRPVWGSKFTININTEMNYWPAELCNLPECHEPLFDHVQRMSINGRRTAREMYGCRGFVAHHNTDIWADTSVQDTSVSAAYWVLGGAWLALHLWEHFLFSTDEEFLQKRAYPLLQGAADFFVDFLIENEDRTLVVSPTVSAENSYYIPNTKTTAAICVGSAMDSQVLTELFTACVEADRILGRPIPEKYLQVLKKLPRPAIASHGGIMEWLEEYEEPEPGHRHVSHLFGIYPGSSITEERFKAAAKVTIKRRLASGGGHTSWSASWLVCLYARLDDSVGALSVIQQYVSHSTLDNIVWNSSTFSNRWKFWNNCRYCGDVPSQS